MHSLTTIRNKNAVVIWLMLCIQLIVLVVLVGGYTRLSGSGLSITEWKPIHGVIPPLNEIEWQEEFAAYKVTPQYKLINSDMSLAGFKAIFWPEYIHRLLARTIGLVFAIPLLIFALRGSIKGKLLWRMVVILALGGLQGGVGWIMVKSGLESNPYVSHIKLATHLSLAFTIFALILWVILDIMDRNNPRQNNNKIIIGNGGSYLKIYKIWFALLCVQIVFGGFMAGLHAGLIYNTWPTMNGEIIPNGLFSIPKQNLGSPPSVQAMHMLQNITFVQFIHRSLAVFITLGFLLWWYLFREYIRIRTLSKDCTLVAVVIFTQFVLGVLTLIYTVPLPIALAHHLTALALWFVTIKLLYRLSCCNNYLNRIS